MATPLNLVIMNILAMIAGIPVLVALYGVIRRQRFFFLLGYLLYALIVVPNELGEYMATGSMAVSYTHLTLPTKA